MSIIDEALRKAAEARKNLPEPDELVSEPQPEPEVERKKKSNKRLIILVIFLFVGCTLLFSIFVVKKPLIGGKIEKQSTPKVSFEEEVIFPVPKPKEDSAKETVIQEAVIQEERSPSLSLSGIIHGYGKPVAVINERIVEEGDFIGGARVVEIGQGGVRLNFEGKDFSLTLR